MNCAHCNAPIQAHVEECNFCHTPTELGRQLKAQRALQSAEDARADELARKQAEHRKAQEAEALRAKTAGEVKALAKRSLLFSTVGMVLTCCIFPVGPFIGLVLAWRARALENAAGLSPSQATLALRVSVGLLVAGVGLFAGLLYIGEQAEAERARLRAIIATADTHEALEQTVACAATELELSGDGYPGYSTSSTLTCGVKVQWSGDEGLLESSFYNSTTRVPVVACFRRAGGRWGLTHLRADTRCEEGPVARDGG